MDFKKEEQDKSEEFCVVEEHNTEAEAFNYKPSYTTQGNKKGKGYIFTGLIGAIVGSLLSLSVMVAFLPQIIDLRGIALGSGMQNLTIEPSKDLTVYSAVAKKAMSSVVGITALTIQRDIFGTRRAPIVGTGVIVDSRGYILTNSHVVADGQSEEVKVILYDGKELPAEVVWQEKSLDLAVIKVNASNLPVAELGDSDKLEVGEIAIAIGNPLGLNFERTLTQGVISGLNRTIPLSSTGTETIENLVQTDASINPGNSGGPLLNAAGQVIGINTAKISSGEGLGFAIPINTAKPIVDQIIEKGEFKRVYLGIRGVEVDMIESTTGTDLQAEYGIYIVEVVADSPAEEFGLRAGDVIQKVQDSTIKSMGALQKELYKYRPGDKVTVTFMRNGKEEKAEVTFRE
jgi:S1-C subfamily serine protease